MEQNNTPCCRGSCGSCGGCGAGSPPSLSGPERELLQQLASVLYLPLGQFLLIPRGCTPQEGTLILSPILLEAAGDSLEQVTHRGELLVSLAKKGLVSLDFDLPLRNYDYGDYYRSALFREFSLRFSGAKEGRPSLRRGSIAITQRGLEISE